MTDYLQALPAGYQLQEYTITRTLGQGGFGITYAARDNHLDSVVAIKEYLPSDKAVRTDGSSISAKSARDKLDFEWGLKRFLTEAKTLARFDHPNIVKIFRFFEQNGTGYMVMEFVQGQTLDQALKHSGTLTEAQIRQWLWPIVDGLRRVHEAGFLHRDIKPQNIMLRSNGSPVLLDFGAARAASLDRTTAMTAIMTPGFAPLEQYQTSGDQGPWTDIYALGAVLHCCITGKRPPDVMDRVTDDPVEAFLRHYAGPYSSSLIEGTCAALSMSSQVRPQDLSQWVALLKGEGEAVTVELPAPTQLESDLAATRIQPVLLQPQSRADTTVTDSRSRRFSSTLTLALVLALAAGATAFVARDTDDAGIAATQAALQPLPARPMPEESNRTKDPEPVQEEPTPAALPAPESTEAIAQVAERALPHLSSLTVYSEPPGALVLLDREPAGKTPLQLEALTEDQAVEIALVLNGYQTTQHVYTPGGQVDDELDVTLKPLTPRFSVQVRPTPADARVRILNIGPRYEPGMKLQSGDYHFEVARAGYETQRIWRKVESEALAFDVTLEQTTYPLTISAIPADASIQILNSETTYEPGVLLPPGNYEVEVAKDGFVTERERILITDRGEFPSIMLTPETTAPESEPVELSEAAKRCQLPVAPSSIQPDADYDALRKAKQSIVELQQALLGYRTCLDASGLQPDQTNGNLIALNQAHNASVDLEQRVADEFNAALRAYKQRQTNSLAKQ